MKPKSLGEALCFTLTACLFAFESETNLPNKFQSKLTPSDELLFSCSFVSSIDPDDCIPDNLSSFTPDNISISIVLTKILDALNENPTKRITANFLPYECTFPQPIFRSLAKKNDSTRYILYTKKQLEELMKANTNWVAYSIFAHEIGHHLYGHSLSSPKDFAHSRARELEADMLSGYVLHKLNATLSDAQSGINAIDNHPPEALEENCTHPTKAKRLEAIKRGYDYQSSPSASVHNLLNIDSLATVRGIEQIFNKGLEFFHLKNYSMALSQLNELEPLLKGKLKADYYNNTGKVKVSVGDILGALKEFDKAIQINDLESEFYFNRAELKKASFQKVLQAESKEDFKQASFLKAQEKAKGF